MNQYMHIFPWGEEIEHKVNSHNVWDLCECEPIVDDAMMTVTHNTFYPLRTFRWRWPTVDFNLYPHLKKY